MESSGNFDRFSIDEDDDDLEDDFSSGSMSFNGRLVISGDPIMYSSVGSPGKILTVSIHNMRFEVELSLSFVTLFVIFIGSYRDSKKIRQWIPVEKVYPTC